MLSIKMLESNYMMESNGGGPLVIIRRRIRQFGHQHLIAVSSALSPAGSKFRTLLLQQSHHADEFQLRESMGRKIAGWPKRMFW
jgi:hypothetical protein